MDIQTLGQTHQVTGTQRVCLVFILIFATSLTHSFLDNNNLYQVLIIADFCVTAHILLRRSAGFFGLLFLISSYAYSHVFLIENIIFNIDLQKIAYYQNLQNFGVDVERFMRFYVIVSIVFRSTFLLFYKERIASSFFVLTHGLPSNGLSSKLVLSILIAYSASLLPYMPTAGYFLSLALVLALNDAIILKIRPKTLGSVLLFLLNVIVSMQVTRTRAFVVNIGILIFGYSYTKKLRNLVGMMCLGIALVFSILLIGEYRDSLEWNVTSDTERGMFIEGEFGAIALQGVHIISLVDENSIPGELHERLIDKLIRPIPLLNNAVEKMMLADRYMKYFFYEMYLKGGGLAFSFVAEMYLFGSFSGVILSGALLGQLSSFLFKKPVGLYLFGAYTWAIIHLFRQEVASNFAWWIGIAIGYFLLQVIGIDRNQRQSQETSIKNHRL